MAKTRIITLLTDFGTADGYVASVKGRILRACPSAVIVDVSHDVPPQDVLFAAFVLAQAAPHFPEDTLHVAVVDPGVGTDRRILAARCGGQQFLVPDNGVLSLAVQRHPLQAMAVVRNTKYVPRTNVSRTFHGRDLFAPVAGHMLNGVSIAALGPTPESYKLLDLPAPAVQNGRLVGRIVHVDGFGNCLSNIAQADLAALGVPLDRLVVHLDGREIGPLTGAYGFAGEGEPLALINSLDALEVAVNQGRAREVLNAGVGAEVRVTVR